MVVLVMSKEKIWKMFKNLGTIESYLLYKEVERLECKGS